MGFGAVLAPARVPELPAVIRALAVCRARVPVIGPVLDREMAPVRQLAFAVLAPECLTGTDRQPESLFERTFGTVQNQRDRQDIQQRTGPCNLETQVVVAPCRSASGASESLPRVRGTAFRRPWRCPTDRRRRGHHRDPHGRRVATLDPLDGRGRAPGRDAPAGVGAVAGVCNRQLIRSRRQGPGSRTIGGRAAFRRREEHRAAGHATREAP